MIQWILELKKFCDNWGPLHMDYIVGNSVSIFGRCFYASRKCPHLGGKY